MGVVSLFLCVVEQIFTSSKKTQFRGIFMAKVPKDKALEATKLAIEVGFRHVDCAHIYNNEEQVGLAIRSKIADGTVKREDIFYTSKLWCNSHRPELVRPALERSLKNLQLDYVDLYLIHFPVSLKPGEEMIPKDENGKVLFDTVDLCATWEAMEKCKDAGLAKSIGVSNFNRRQLEMILNKPGLKYKPVCNQVSMTHEWMGEGDLDGSVHRYEAMKRRNVQYIRRERE
uniref:NADP-dependent oxidoreductase domain-containing protein n=1 Tax=Mandrillus leucophaeus TaxID=9568 RepID=A0A2K5YIA2_MANLE